jgi:hypothetical protein
MKFCSAVLFAAALTVGSTANADVLCENQDKTVKIQTFHLSEDVFSFEPIKVAAVLKQAGVKALYTGTAQVQPGRVGTTTSYSLQDEQGAAVSFSTVKTMIFNRCTRVSCDQIIKIVGTLEVAGVPYSLTCTSSVF